MTALGVLLLGPRGEPVPAYSSDMDIAAVVVTVVMAALAVGFVVLLRGRSRVMDYHAHLDDRFELQSAHKMSHGGSGGA